MPPESADKLRLSLDDATSVSARLDTPASPGAVYVFAHGAGAGMDHAFMAEIAQGLARRGIAVLRFQFPFMERGETRVDPPAVAHAAIRAAVAQARQRFPRVPCFAGGKSFGGRMASQAQAAAPIAGVRGLVFVGFPLHPAGKPGSTRAEHLARVDCPMLFLQGTRDALAEPGLVRAVVAKLGPRATLRELDGADHAFHVLKRSGRDDAAVRSELLDAAAAWMLAIARDA